MKVIQAQVQKLFGRSFTVAELRFLNVQPQFIEACRHMRTVREGLTAVEIGALLIKQTWHSDTLKDSPLTPLALSP